MPLHLYFNTAACGAICLIPRIAQARRGVEENDEEKRRVKQEKEA